MILSLSRHSANDIGTLLALPFHLTLGLHNTLVTQFEEEAKKQKADAEKAQGSVKSPSVPSNVSYGGKSMSFK